MINLENLTAEEAEALAYSEGYPGTARLFARIADLQRALGQAVAEIDQLKTDLHAARYERAYLGANSEQLALSTTYWPDPLDR